MKLHKLKLRPSCLQNFFKCDTFFLHVLCLLLFLKKIYSVIFHIILHLTLLQHVVSMLMAVDVTISDLQETHTMANTHKMLLLQEHGMI